MWKSVILLNPFSSGIVCTMLLVVGVFSLRIVLSKPDESIDVSPRFIAYLTLVPTILALYITFQPPSCPRQEKTENTSSYSNLPPNKQDNLYNRVQELQQRVEFELQQRFKTAQKMRHYRKEAILAKREIERLRSELAVVSTRQTSDN
eukprot:TRINITY_DN3474_c0_g1_i4.p1 TRINITY_DN3474_c0_g1~~TRINITY_DN3474_c0_g1_i4.p1  ORF type:complete len:148 (-),score=14.16 TRINITY_DN3474_c0_g1_i4:36-479(-)